MTRKKRSEAFLEKSQTNRQHTNKYNNKKIQDKKRNRRKRKQRDSLIKLLLVFIILMIPLFLYQKFINTPQRTIKRAVSSIKNLDYEKQEKYFDKITNVEDILKKSYSSDKKEQEEFLKANFANLKVDVKSKKRTRDGLEVEVDVTNISYVDVYDNLKNKDTNVHATYIKNLSNDKQNKLTVRAKLLLEKKFTYYKIYESRDFVNGLLGGALKYSDK
ncbi:MAG: hypothetical protein E7I76_07700 [Anaerococcus vaginalis]|uniref:hypothetical protein n=1 Tax=Anaerococcus vaginalis TaxID=33037 RepID=UPI002914C146|nr:hypothetical protein [Anaerococcus vaginalis]MDU4447865.1 hypothetical protein [Anaerococcus vaginalis]MDU6181469.1 hypothetical protein [Anaerococcus vaginalis]MDU7432530.1 hypothetical protein [Anaerococcus vaginalis]